ncbi:hypothetical protein RM549_05095 [Salegentibacter sp. F188]|uniref:Uncharacterized protein n=1 Tax=Autumnicola patrickiae TaxID=3075591 RepID=A0ABU3DZI4_9FLAO|nr:hypothetical protein [Salegentibacter sp. F188]MDT0689149.1 hypothetical protein [Salegentibacter sp. F188]
MDKLLILFFLFLGITLSGQQIELDIHNTSLEEYLQMEEKLDSYRIPATSNLILLTGEALPIEFIREEKMIPNLYKSYIFKAKDSMMMGMHYRWDERRPGRVEFNFPKNGKFTRAMVERFHHLKKMIIQKYGEPTAEENVGNSIFVGPNDVLSKTEKWHPNDSTEIELSTSIYQFKVGTDTTRQYHKIHLYIRNSKIEKRESRFSKLIMLSNEFLKSLDERDIAKSREFFSDSIHNTFSNKQLVALMDNIDFNREPRLSIADHFGHAGNEVAVLQFTYKDENSYPPDEPFKIIFDIENKIIGIVQISGKVESPN